MSSVSYRVLLGFFLFTEFSRVRGGGGCGAVGFPCEDAGAVGPQKKNSSAHTHTHTTHNTHTCRANTQLTHGQHTQEQRIGTAETAEYRRVLRPPPFPLASFGVTEFFVFFTEFRRWCLAIFFVVVF